MIRCKVLKIILLFLILYILVFSSIAVAIPMQTSKKTIYGKEQYINYVNQINITFKSSNYTLYGEIYYPSKETGTYPGLVFCEGFGGYISAYNWIPKALAEKGYVVIIYDPPGQGKSEGIFPIRTTGIPSLNLYLRHALLIETPTHFLFGEWVTAASDALTYLLEESPVKDMVDNTSIGVIGHSLGGITATEAAAKDKRVRAVVALSQGDFRIIHKIDVPIQFQGGCFDLMTHSIPILLSCYSKANTPKEIITIELGTHFGFTTAFNSLCPCPRWQKDICLRYAVGWFDYFLKNKQEVYETITTCTDHLSMLIKSRYDFGDGECLLA